MATKPNTALQPEQKQAAVNIAAKRSGVVYPFRVNGTERVYEVDLPHLRAMLSRKDMAYIGTAPLPKFEKDPKPKPKNDDEDDD